LSDFHEAPKVATKILSVNKEKQMRRPTEIFGVGRGVGGTIAGRLLGARALLLAFLKLNITDTLMSII
jgi:hypothetical protein